MYCMYCMYCTNINVSLCIFCYHSGINQKYKNKIRLLCWCFCTALNPVWAFQIVINWLPAIRIYQRTNPGTIRFNFLFYYHTALCGNGIYRLLQYCYIVFILLFYILAMHRLNIFYTILFYIPLAAEPTIKTPTDSVLLLVFILWFL